MNISEDAGALLERVRRAREERRTVRRAGAEVGLDAAYEIQAALGEGREIKGYKLGLISAAKQEQMGIDSPIYGRVYPEMLLESPVKLSGFIQPRLEPELAVVLGGDLPPGAAPGAASLAVGGLFLAIDFLDSIWEGYRFSISDVVADNTSGGGFLLGERLLDVPLEGKLSLYLNGELLTEGPLEALGKVDERLVWLAGEVGGLKAGQVVFLGSPAAALETRPGTLELRGPEGSALIARIEE
ncbi:MAG: 4-oxalocrotonate decarboxylase [Rubrobacter sp.]|nr:4-oxalocrotonate decarboxylase [Rubrobacter sp.]